MTATEMMVPTASNTQLWGVATDVWSLVGTAVSLVVLIAGAIVALNTLRGANLQRMGESLRTVLAENRDGIFQEAQRVVLEHFPVPTTIDDVSASVADFIENVAPTLNDDDLRAARFVVGRLNDDAALIDRSTIHEVHLYGQMYPRILGLSVRLDPLILAVSARRDMRWGIRVRRLRRGVTRYYRESPLHNEKPFELQRHGDPVTIIPACRRHWIARAYHRARHAMHANSRYCYMQAPLRSKKHDDRDVKAAAAVLRTIDEAGVAVLDRVLRL